MQNLQLRGYNRADLQALFVLDEICFEELFRFSRAEMRRFAEAKNAKVIIAEVDADLAGFCIVQIIPAHAEKVGYVTTLDVHPALRRRGIAHALMRNAEAKAKEAGCTAMLLHVFVANTAAIQFYERERYVRQTTQKDFYGDGMDALLYSKILAT